MSTLSNNISRFRKALGMTQEELAKRMGYKSKSTINKIELGINDVSQSKIVQFADALNTTPAKLLGWEEPLTETVTEEEKELLEIYRLIPFEKKALATAMLRTIINVTDSENA